MYDLAVSNPWVLLAIPAGFAGLYLILRLKIPDKAQRLRAFAVRGAIITFAILALAGVTGAFAAKRAEAVVGVPLMFLAALRTGHDGWLIARHDQARLQKVRSNGTSCSNRADFAA